MLLQQNIERKTDHLKLLGPLIEESEVSILCAGWLKHEGLSLLLPSIDLAVERRARIVIYSNKKETELKAIQELSRREKVEHFLADDKHRYLHTKIYYFKSKDEYTAVIGSANLTKGGLTSNEELSVVLKGQIGDDQHEEINDYMNNLRSVLRT